MSEKVIDHIAFRAQYRAWKQKPIKHGRCQHCQRLLRLYQRGLCGRCCKNREILTQYPCLPVYEDGRKYPDPNYPPIELLPDAGAKQPRLPPVDKAYPDTTRLGVCRHGLFVGLCVPCEAAERRALAQREGREEEQWDDQDYEEE